MCADSNTKTRKRRRKKTLFCLFFSEEEKEEEEEEEIREEKEDNHHHQYPQSNAGNATNRVNIFFEPQNIKKKKHRTVPKTRGGLILQAEESSPHG